MLSFLTIGTILGLSAGFAPGPLLALVISETLQHDIKAGIKVSLAPILTDLPLIVITVFVLEKLARFQQILGVISIAGGFFILYLAINSIKIKGIDIGEGFKTPRSLQKGILVNVLSPHPYLFWFSVGAPTTIKALEHSLASAIFFIMSFYILLVGSKIMLAVLTGKSRSFLKGKPYVSIMRLLGFFLLVFAGLLLRDGLHLLGMF